VENVILDFEEAAMYVENVFKTLILLQQIPHRTKLLQKNERKETYEGTILTNVNLNGRGSAKQISSYRLSADRCEL